jgi:SAM-dependent methyltransferase
VYRCLDCGFTFLWPQPPDPAAAYEDSYLAGYAAAGLGTVAQANLARFCERLHRVRRQAGRLLEVGVGSGAFMQLAASRGWKVVGLDVSRFAAEQVQSRLRLPVVVSAIDDAPFERDAFDVIHMSHVLEHLDDPVRALRRVSHWLAGDGRLIVEVPNELENLYTWMRLRSFTSRPYRVASTHLCFFTPRSLEQVVINAGMAVEFQRTFRDTTDPRPFRRGAKVLVGRVEAAANRGPLIELVARPGAAT